MKNKFIITAFIVATSSGCVTRTLLLSSPVVSMTHTSNKGGHALKGLGPVETKYCIGDDAISTKTNNIGLMDEVITRAQKEKAADFITDAQIFSEVKLFSAQCIILTGNGAK